MRDSVFMPSVAYLNEIIIIKTRRRTLCRRAEWNEKKKNKKTHTQQSQ